MDKDYVVPPAVSVSNEIKDFGKCYLNINPELEKMIREIHAALVKK